MAAKVKSKLKPGEFTPAGPGGVQTFDASAKEVAHFTANPSGITPIDLRVLVKPDKVEEKTKGGILLPDEVNERNQMAECRALLVATGENAFCEVSGKKPKPGDRVLIAKYAGIVTKGDDGEEYRLCNDADICAVLG